MSHAITKSNPIHEVNNKYCQLLLEDIYFSYLETKGSPSAKWDQRWQHAFKVSSIASEIENTKRNFEIVGQTFTGFCDYLPHFSEERGWTFDNLIGILRGAESSGTRSRSELAFLKNTSNRILMHYLNTSEVRSSQKYSNSDVNQYKDIILKAFAMTDLSTDASSISWLRGVVPESRSIYDSVSEQVQQDLEKPWKEIQQTFLNILSELREMSVIHLETLSRISSEVLYFCYQRQILCHLPIAVDVIEKSFSTSINEIKMEPEMDSETGEEWLEFRIRIKGEVEDVLDRYDKYTERLISLLPWSARYKMRLSYNII